MVEVAEIVKWGAMVDYVGGGYSANNTDGTNYNVCGNDNLSIFIGGCNVCSNKNG